MLRFGRKNSAINWPCDVRFEMAVVVWARGRGLTADAANVRFLAAVHLHTKLFQLSFVIMDGRDLLDWSDTRLWIIRQHNWDPNIERYQSARIFSLICFKFLSFYRVSGKGQGWH